MEVKFRTTKKARGTGGSVYLLEWLDSDDTVICSKDNVYVEGSEDGIASFLAFEAERLKQENIDLFPVEELPMSEMGMEEEDNAQVL